MKTLGEALPEEMARVRDEILPVYESLGISGLPALVVMRHYLNAAAKAIAENDVETMMVAYEALKGYEL